MMWRETTFRIHAAGRVDHDECGDAVARDVKRVCDLQPKGCRFDSQLLLAEDRGVAEPDASPRWLPTSGRLGV